MRSIFLPLIRSVATCAAVCGFDWLSRSAITTEYFLPPIFNPSLKAVRSFLSRYGFGSPKPAAGPVLGET